MAERATGRHANVCTVCSMGAAALKFLAGSLQSACNDPELAAALPYY